MSELLPPAQRLTLPDGSTLAYAARPGRDPTVVFLCGLRSDMTGTKAAYLDQVCAGRGQAYLRFDYSGHGQSDGEFVDGTIGRWAADALAVIAETTDGPLVLVGSSMGGWIMSLIARTIPERIAGMVGIAAAPDFSEDLVWEHLTEAQRDELRERGQVELPSEYDDQPYPVTLAFIEDGRHQRVLGDVVPVDCPVHLFHGMQDPDVPWETSIRLAGAIRSNDVQITLLKPGGHRLSEPDELALVRRGLEIILDRQPG